MDIAESIAKILIALIPNLGIVMGSIVIILFFKWYFEYKKFLVESGKYQPLQIANYIKDFRIFILLLGIVSIFSGIPLTLVFLIVAGKSFVLLGGLIPLFVGLGLILFYFLTIKNK